VLRVDYALLATELRSRHGVTTTGRLRQLGISERSIRTLVSRGQLERVVRGVLVAAAWPDSIEHRMALACAATGGVVCFPTAGSVWALRKTPRTDVTHVVIHEGRRVDPIPGVAIARTCYLPELDVVRREDGIAVTSPPRTAFDAAWWLGDDDLESLIEDGLHRGHFIIPTLQGLGHRTRSRGRPGSRRFREVLDRRDPVKRPVASDYELRLERALRRRGFPQLHRQCRLELGGGRVIHPDLGIPECGFYIEVDHLTWHGGRIADDYDCQRDLEIEALGHHVERVTDVAIDRHLSATVEALWSIWQRVLRSHAVGS
jgi:very-short-patch-repair endonuclease